MSNTAGGGAEQRGIRVAVVDDHRLVMDCFSALLTLRHPDISVVVAESSWPEFLAHQALPVDVVVMGLTVGGEHELRALLRQLDPATRTVVLARKSDPVSVHTALQAGAHGVVSACGSAEELVHAIREAAAGRHYRARAATTTLSELRAASPGLGKQEFRALMLFASGRSVRAVATHMSTTEETIKSYLKRARRKYLLSGVDLGTKTLLRRYAARSGWLAPDEPVGSAPR